MKTTRDAVALDQSMCSRASDIAAQRLTLRYVTRLLEHMQLCLVQRIIDSAPWMMRRAVDGLLASSSRRADALLCTVFD